MASKKEKVHLALVVRKKTFLTTRELDEIASKFGLGLNVIRTMLVRSGVLVPLLFRHQYYVRDMNQLASRNLLDPLVGAALSCNNKFGQDWYFGLHTALKFNLSSVQTQTEGFVITPRQVRPPKRFFGGVKFNFSRIRGVPMKLGVVERNGLRYSGVTRTVLDFLLLGVKKGDTRYAELVLSEVLEGGFKNEFLREYPKLLKHYSTGPKISGIIHSHLSGETRVV